jgi:hypothetical protein
VTGENEMAETEYPAYSEKPAGRKVSPAAAAAIS